MGLSPRHHQVGHDFSGALSSGIAGLKRSWKEVRS